MKRRVISTFLAIALMFTSVDATAFAADVELVMEGSEIDADQENEEEVPLTEEETTSTETVTNNEDEEIIIDLTSQEIPAEEISDDPQLEVDEINSQALIEDEEDIIDLNEATSQAEIKEKIEKKITSFAANLHFRDSVDDATIRRLYADVVHSHPEFFYVSDTLNYNEEEMIYKIDYLATEDEANAMQLAYSDALDEFKGTVKSWFYDYEKILFINDFIVQNASPATSKSGKFKNTAYGCLVDGEATSKGYAMAVIALANEVGIESTFISSEATGQCWNIVREYINAFHLDTYMDDPEPNGSKIYISRNYMLGSSNEKYFAIDHTKNGKNDWRTASSTLTASSCQNTYFDRDYTLWDDIHGRICVAGEHSYYVMTTFSTSIRGLGMIYGDRCTGRTSRSYATSVTNYEYKIKVPAIRVAKATTSGELVWTDKVYYFSNGAVNADSLVKTIENYYYRLSGHYGSAQSIYVQQGGQRWMNYLDRFWLYVSSFHKWGYLMSDEFQTQVLDKQGGMSCTPNAMYLGGQMVTHTDTGIYSFDGNIQLKYTLTDAERKKGYIGSIYYKHGLIYYEIYNSKGEVAETNSIAFWSSPYTFNLELLGGECSTDVVYLARRDTFKYAVNPATGKNDGLPIPSKNGYEFQGWYTSMEYTSKVTDSTRAASSYSTLYAKWKANKYKLKLHSNLETDTVMTQDMVCGVPSMLKANKSKKTGYVFVGWNTKQDGSGVSYKDEEIVKDLSYLDGSVVDLYGQWRLQTYTIKFDANGGSAGSIEDGYIQTMKYGDEIEIFGNEFTMEGQAILSWYNSLTGKTIKSGSLKNLTLADGVEITLTAQWGPPVEYANADYLVTLDSNFEGGPAQIVIPLDKNEVYKLTSTVFNRPGYTIKSFNTKADASGTRYKLGNIKNFRGTLYAIYDGNENSITYDLDGGKVASVVTKYTTGYGAYLTSPTKAGYRFTGWQLVTEEGKTPTAFLAKDKLTITTESYGPVKLLASYELIPYTIRYHKNDGTNAVETVVYTDSLADVSFADIVKKFDTDEKSVVAFTERVDGKGKKYYTSKLYSTFAAVAGQSYELDLYAQWGKKAYNISYENVDGVARNLLKMTYQPSSSAISLPVIKRDGYVFKGWEISSAAGKASIDENGKLAAGSTGDIVLKAQLESVHYTIYIDNNDDSGNAILPIDSGKFYTFDTVLDTASGVDKTTFEYAHEREGYIFMGLNTKKTGKGTYLTPVSGNRVFSFNGLKARNGQRYRVYAIWKPIEYKLTYTGSSDYENELIESTNKNPGYYVFNTRLSLKKIDMEGNKFLGWRVVKDGKDTDEILKAIPKGYMGDLTLKAVFSPFNYTLVIDRNGGIQKADGKATNITVNTKAVYNEKYDISSYVNTFGRTGYIFKGFAYDKKGRSMVDSSMLVSNASNKSKGTGYIYCIWEACTGNRLQNVKVESKVVGKLSFSCDKPETISDEVEYRLQYSDSLNFMESETFTVKENKGVLDKVPGGKTYFRIRCVIKDSMGNNCLSAWSATVSTTVLSTGDDTGTGDRPEATTPSTPSQDQPSGDNTPGGEDSGQDSTGGTTTEETPDITVVEPLGPPTEGSLEDLRTEDEAQTQ